MSEEVHHKGIIDGPEIMSYNLRHAPRFSGSAYFAPSVSGDYYPAYPVDNPTREVIQRPEYVFVARCKNCEREYHLDPDRPIPPAFCGLGMTHGCGSSEWHVFKRQIEVEKEPEYQDDCVYSGEGDLQVDKFCRPIGMVELPPMNEKEARSFREKWDALVHHVRTQSLSSLWRGSHEDGGIVDMSYYSFDYSQMRYEDR